MFVCRQKSFSLLEIFNSETIFQLVNIRKILIFTNRDITKFEDEIHVQTKQKISTIITKFNLTYRIN